ncbi:OmpA family protein [Mucilaginibacter ginsenosidivorax]|uniref:OmpA family protein n=1 Tax=Mucilaginibacter ginsenosidivorax TaxID=862126 RepID=A0A5B8W0N1_9SPHI|nr:OmpA family protein [Mucilaginibacter ginsenosidivorax]QEC76392.1 OmpA family protein [Mucilaginibacter ginsenosidivorax]
MNYSTLKKTAALSFASLLVAGMVSAQTDSTKTGSAKLFGGIGQYNTLSIGVSVGITDGLVPFTNNTTNKFAVDLGYGVSLRQQLSHTFSLQLDYLGGKVTGKDDAANSAAGQSVTTTSKFGISGYKTSFNSGALSAVFNIASVSFLHRKNSVNFYGSAGLGLDVYKIKENTGPTGTVVTLPFGDKTVKELFAPVGLGVKFKLSDALALNLGYTVSFIQGYNFAGTHTYPTFSHYSYTYGGLEYTFGPKTKQNLEWVNPVAQMYDELYDAALRQEVEALKGRVTNVETAVNDLKKDSDGDGVADQFDKCPGTAAGSVVDGSGCVIVFPKDTTKMEGMAPKGTAYSNIQFEFDSSVLRTSSYPVLDATSADLRASGKGVEVDGFASSEGTAAHNLSLSKDRANSVKTYLVNSGVDAKKVKIKGYGETMPIADNSTEDGRVLNRRVQFKQK